MSRRNVPPFAAAIAVAALLAAGTAAWALVGPDGEDAQSASLEMLATDDTDGDEDAAEEDSDGDAEAASGADADADTDGGEPSVEVDEAGTVTVEAPEEFSNAEIVDVSCTLSDGSAYTTSAVVAEHTLSFFAPEAGSYLVEQSTYPTTYGYDGLPGMDVWGNIDLLTTTRYLSDLVHAQGRSTTIPSISSSSETGGLSLSNAGDNLSGGALLFAPYKGVSKTSGSAVSYGSADDPITSLVHFVGVGEDASGIVEMTRTTMDGLLGYSSQGELALAAAEGAADGESPLSLETDFEPTYFLVEDRDEDTGRLLASVLFAPSEDSSPSAQGEGGQNAFNLVINPTEELLASRLGAHSRASESGVDSAADAATLAQAEESSELVLVANLDTMCAYTTGGKVYTLDVATLSDGVFSAGDELLLSYVAASEDANAVASTTGVPSSYYETLAQATEESLTVDDDGYIRFTLYGGGVYALTFDTQECAAAVEELAESLTFNVPQAEEDDGEAADDDAATDGGGGSDAEGDDASSDEDDSDDDDSTTPTTVTTSSIVTTGVAGVSTAVTAAGIDTDVTATAADVSSDADDSGGGASGVSDTDDEAQLDLDALASGDDDAQSGDSSDGGLLSKLFRNDDGSLSWPRIALAVAIGALLVAGVVFLVLLLLRRRRKKDNEALEEDAGQDASVATSGVAEAMTHEQATAAAVAAAKAAREADAAARTAGGLASGAAIAAGGAQQAAQRQVGAGAARRRASGLGSAACRAAMSCEAQIYGIGMGQAANAEQTKGAGGRAPRAGAAGGAQ